MYLYPYLKSVLLAISEVLASTDTWDASVSLETVSLHKLLGRYELSFFFLLIIGACLVKKVSTILYATLNNSLVHC